MKPTIQLLYAEDNPQDADLTRAHFAEFAPEFEVHIVTTGAACLEQIQRQPPDLLLLDHHLPDTDGAEILKKLLRLTPGLPVVLVTGVGNEELVVRALRLGAVNYVPKQGDYLHFLPDLLRDALCQHRQRLPVAAALQRILYVEHLAMDIDLTLSHFAQHAAHFVVEVVSTCAEALARLAQTNAYDLLLIDLRMPDQSGLDFVREAKRRHLPMPPFIMLSGTGDEAAAIATLSLGAADYVVKRNGYLDQLTYRMDHAMAHHRLRLDVARREQIEEELRAYQLALLTQNAELRLAQQELATSRERYFDLYHLAPVGYCTLSEQGVILEANLSAASLLGVTLSALVQQAVTRFVLREDQDVFYLLRKRLMESGEPQSLELRMTAQPDGKPLWVHLATSVKLDEDGALVCLVVLTDISRRKQDEAERATLEAQLQQAGKMECVGRLAGGVAHDFNNMMGVILGHVELALYLVEAGQPIYEDLLEIQQAAQRSADLTRQLLAFARKQTVQPRVLDLNDTVAEMMAMLSRLIGEGIQVNWRPAVDLWPIEMDASQLGQILTNLCINARDAIADVGTIVIETANRPIDVAFCATQAEATPGDYVRLSVADDGSGMGPETLAHIFEPFFTTKKVGEGTGLGLASVEGAVKQNHGFLTVTSAPGQGTTFSIYLPRHLGESALKPKPAPVAHSGGRETILLVEDDAALLKIATRMLAAQGYTVLPADAPGPAIQLAKQYPHPIHLLLTDVIMPGMNGHDLAGALKTLRPGMRCLFMSGYTASVIAGHSPGPLDFIQKPFSVAALTALVRQALDRASEPCR